MPRLYIWIVPPSSPRQAARLRCPVDSSTIDLSQVRLLRKCDFSMLSREKGKSETIRVLRTKNRTYHLPITDSDT